MKKNILKNLRLLFACAWLLVFIVAFIVGIALVVKTDPSEYFFQLSVALNIGYIAYIFYIHERLSDMRGHFYKQDERIDRIEKWLMSRRKKIVDEVKGDDGK
jgi:membrane protein YdbS with pleckstrin-like domain